ncbi:MAG TPA: hypothetical protein P5568_07405, partial [Acidobacteriota bacterium]|nr:hypothetical protein [Acidobacteriota bacterium]
RRQTWGGGKLLGGLGENAQKWAIQPSRRGRKFRGGLGDDAMTVERYLLLGYGLGSFWWVCRRGRA